LAAKADKYLASYGFIDHGEDLISDIIDSMHFFNRQHIGALRIGYIPRRD